MNPKRPLFVDAYLRTSAIAKLRSSSMQFPGIDRLLDSFPYHKSMAAVSDSLSELINVEYVLLGMLAHWGLAIHMQEASIY